MADFRDAWTLNPWGERVARPVAALSRLVERQVLAHATRIVVAAESVELAGLPLGDPKVTVIRNGVDENDFDGLSEPRDRSRFRLSYVGSLYGDYNCSPIFIAIRRLIDDGTLDPRIIDLRIVGNVSIAPTWSGLLPMTSTGYVDHKRALGEMLAADALLFHIPATSAAPSGKIYEYLATGRPILCVASKTNLGYRLVERMNAGICVEPDDLDGVANAIMDLFSLWQSGRLTLPPTVRDETLRVFSRRKLAGELASVLDAAIDAIP